jgi:hypothetical protein
MFEMTISLTLIELDNKFSAFLNPINLRGLAEAAKNWLMQWRWDVEDVKTEYVDPTGDKSKAYVKFKITSSNQLDSDDAKNRLKSGW